MEETQISWKQQIKEGLLTNNPILMQALGLCAALAVTTSLLNGLGMGVTALVILTLSNVLFSLLRPLTPDRIRKVLHAIVIAGFASCADLLVQAYFPDLSKSLGVFLPLLAVNGVLLGRAETFAPAHGVGASFLDGICQGSGYALALAAAGVIREFLGTGVIASGLLREGAGIRVFPFQFAMELIVQPAGGFLVLAGLLAAAQWVSGKIDPKERRES